MKKALLAALLPAAVILAACEPGTSSSTPTESTESTAPATSITSSSSSEEAAGTTSSSSSSSEQGGGEIVIPTVTPTLHITVEGIDVLDENAIYVGSPNLEGASASVWGYEMATLQDDGTWTYVFPEVEIEQMIIYKVYVQNREAGPWTGIVCDECPGNDTNLDFITLEGQSDYYQTVTFSNQPDSSKVLAEATFTLTATDGEGNPIDQAGLYIVAYDSVNQGGNETVWENLGDGKYSHTYENLPIGSFTINPYLEATNDITQITWNKSQNLGDAGYIFDLVAGTSEYSFSATWTNIPSVGGEDTPSDGYDVTFNLVLTEDLPADAKWPQVVLDDNWISSGIVKGEGEVDFTYTTNLAAGSHNVYFYWWNGSADTTLTHDGADRSPYTFNVESEMTVTCTGSFTNAGGNLGTYTVA